MTSKFILPLGFSQVFPGVYRSAYPAAKTYPYLNKLNLKTIICLSPNDVRNDLTEYCNSNNIKLLLYDIKINQDPFLVMASQAIADIIDIAVNNDNQPLLIFCTNGKVRTGCVVACLRKQLGWSMSSIISEFEQFTEPEGGLGDLQFIDAFGT